MMAGRSFQWPTIVTGPLLVDLLDDRAYLDGVLVPISPACWTVLVRLARSLGKVVRHEDLAAALWPSPRRTGGITLAREPNWAIRQIVNRLRRDLGYGCYLIVNESGVGYRLVDAPPERR